MNHYDGPAFYRKYRRPEKSAKQPVSPQFKVPGKRLKHVDEEPAIFQQDEPQREELKQREEKRWAEKRPETPPEPSKPIKNDWQPAATHFRPTQVPKQLNRSVEQQPRLNYTAIIKQYFQKTDDDVLLFDDGAQTANEPAETAQNRLTFEPASSTEEAESTSVTGQTQAEESAPEQTQTAPQEEHTTADEPEKTDNNEQRIAAIQQRIDHLKAARSETPSEPAESETPNTDGADSDSSTLAADDRQQPITPAATTTDTAEQESANTTKNEEMALSAPETNAASTPREVESAAEQSATHTEGTEQADTAPSDDEQTAVVTQTPGSVQPVEQREPQTQPSEKQASETGTKTAEKDELERGLGHSLGDILAEENTSSQMNKLALFQDKPTAKPVSEVSQDDRGYQFPSTSLLTPPVETDENALDEWIEHQGEVLDETLQAFHVDAHVVDWTVGPTVTQFQVHLALGVKVNKITNLTDDLKLALAAKDIRIEAPIPGKTTVGIEIPNPKTRPVMLSEVLESKAFKDSASPLTVALGVDLFGQPRVTDLRKMPHGLIAGATGSGKSVFINSLLISLLYKATPAQLRLLLIDPKAVELAPYDGLPHLLSPVISDPQAAAAALKWAVKEMDDRYDRLAAAGVRNVEQYNDRAELTGDYAQKLPYIVIVIDELADLMMMASSEVQDYIVRITQKARAAGIHLLIATQRPSVDIVTGTIKNNIPTRVAFMVSSQVDSRTIIDTSGAERLLGKGDMLFLGNGASQPVRLQGTFVDKEVDRVTDFVRTQGKPHYAFDPDGLLEKQQVQESQDELMPEVLDYIVQEKTVSTSKLQRVFSIGYNRAANLIDTLENKQYISGQNGSKPREVFLTEKQLAEMRAPRTD
ncbi:cell division protein FtsK [Secundilactobacillus pentosiphilus]|uniref:DNA translocase FtsK n=1 Tax=Secundilactobacillus pentosiphilus TaxID=1714682 RepID=A0A1Z5IVS9_9LACO|nr:DNA translocase FtsK [Secundilactobacillus pentosiphilus]GAX05776.1 cell division protein FtsK [Secundilactobacillus pentosiphilus]